MNHKTGVLLVNTGSPDSTGLRDIKRYLKQFLMDKRVIDIPRIPRWLLVNLLIAPTRSKKSQIRYKRIWDSDGSPLIRNSQKTRNGLSRRLPGNYSVEVAMRYGRPSIQEKLEALRDSGMTRLYILPLFPQYASATSGSIIEEVFACLSRWTVIPPTKVITAFYDHPLFISAWIEKGKKALTTKPDHVLFSFHGIPESQILKADNTGNICLKTDNCCESEAHTACYRAQCIKTARLISEGLDLPEHMVSTAFQSRLGKAKWITPYTGETIRRLGESGIKKLVVFCPAFTADCLETIDEIQFEETENFKRYGGQELIMVPSLNDNGMWIDCLANLILN